MSGGETFTNSMLKSRQTAGMIEIGTVASVNVRELTIDWVSLYSGRTQLGVQIMTPYLHFNNGEGFTCIPEVGAICALCWPSDENNLPFVLGFLSAPEKEGAPHGDLQAEIMKPGVETEEDITPAQTTGSSGSTVQPKVPSEVTFRAGRDILNPGDMFWQGRDDNFVILRRGGVLQLGSTKICQRMFIPTLNYIKDFCENYALTNLAGTLSWEVKRPQQNVSGNAPTELLLVAREYAQDKKASIKINMGSLDNVEKVSAPNPDKTFIEVAIASGKVDPTTGKIDGSPEYVLRLDKAGNTYMLQAGTRTVEITGEDRLTVTSNQTVVIKGTQTTTITGPAILAYNGGQSVTGTDSTEAWSGSKVIAAGTMHLGSAGANQPVVLGKELMTWLTTHTHPGNNVPPAQGPMVGSIVSKKIFVE